MTKYTQIKHSSAQRASITSKGQEPLLVDRLIYIAAIVEPIITIPQAVIIFRDQTAAGVSLSSWIGFQVLTTVWIWYALVHKQKLILVYQGLFFVVQAFVIAGAVVYGASWW